MSKSRGYHVEAEPGSVKPQRDGKRYGKWTITYEPPPIPVRDLDWSYVRDNYDASYEGPEDGWVSNGLAGRAASVEACIAEIEEREADEA